MSSFFSQRGDCFAKFAGFGQRLLCEQIRFAAVADHGHLQRIGVRTFYVLHQPHDLLGGSGRQIARLLCLFDQPDDQSFAQRKRIANFGGHLFECLPLTEIRFRAAGGIAAIAPVAAGTCIGLSQLRVGRFSVEFGGAARSSNGDFAARLQLGPLAHNRRLSGRQLNFVRSIAGRLARRTDRNFATRKQRRKRRQQNRPAETVTISHSRFTVL